MKQLVKTDERKTRVCAPEDEVWPEDEYAKACVCRFSSGPIEHRVLATLPLLI